MELVFLAGNIAAQGIYCDKIWNPFANARDVCKRFMQWLNQHSRLDAITQEHVQFLAVTGPYLQYSIWPIQLDRLQHLKDIHV